VRNRGSDLRIVGWIVGWKFRPEAAKFFRMMVARDGVEPPTPAFSGPSTELPKWSGISGSY
jgi:hypothetical protein